MTTREPTRVSVPVVLIGFLLVLVDGFDSATISVVVPQLAADWGLAPSDFTYPIAATNAGVAVGYMIAGWLAARFRTAPTLYAGLLVAAIGSALSAVVLVTESMPLLTLARVVTGLGIGVVLPAAISVTTSLNPAAMRQRISVLVTLGLASGIAVGGLVGKTVLTRWGPAGMYWVAAAATIAAAAVAVAVLPWRGEPAARTTDEAASGRVQELLVPAYRSTTLLLWAFSFLVFITAYMLTSWIPTILVSFGFTPTEAPIGLTYLSIGGVLGGLCLLGLAARWGIGRAMLVAAATGVVFLTLLGLVGAGGQPLLLLILGAGAGVVACQIGQLTMAVSVYSDALRTTGVGFAAAIGRIGSIIGPAVGGALIALSIEPSTVMLLAAGPVLLALFGAVALVRRATDQASSPRAAESVG